MGQASPRYTAEFKKKTVDPYDPKGTTYAAVARDLGIDPGTLSSWVKAACGTEGEAEDTDPFQVAEENRKPRREARRLSEENEILLKASAFLAGKQLRGRPSSHPSRLILARTACRPCAGRSA